MSRYNPYSTSGLKKFETERQRKKALDLTRQFEAERQALTSILQKSPTIKDMSEWMGAEEIAYFKAKKFGIKKPVKGYHKPKPARPTPGFIDRLFGRASKIEQDYLDLCARVEADNAEVDRQHEAAVKKWEDIRLTHEAEQQKMEASEAARAERTNQKIRDIKQSWQTGEAETVVQYVAAVMKMSDHPQPLVPRVKLQFDRPSKLVLIDYQLPLPSAMPTTKTVRYNATSGEFSTTQISQASARALYDGVCYQVCLRAISDTFRGDKPRNIDTIAFNGNVEAVNAATGKKSTETILSILVTRDEIAGIDLKHVDPKACFKALKGISASSLAGLAAVPPVLTFNKQDRRFIKAEDVQLIDDGSVNLAAMSWEDFEHLVRQVFNKEFAARGGEVKVTQSSADGGVDAIAFDPDPITGGKIVIQAKRYTRPVGVSAVRDLYGTAQSEGASRGILVTTADFGPDAHKFVKDKPLTLLNGGQLLGLLEKHGMRARIDIAQARKDMGLTGKISKKVQG
ncbi:restriction endonuclease [Paracoccus caeni]|uniref:Restriction endonuclease n=1 Tax=Paracoccus caeni TaxID=657651 RepID=A0A934SGL3_9RHOB|nr:restriction endonuclease [Paracoccus caeni]MBK4214819.1 restriction endonuclease [Paracoccus caeni]